MKTTTYTYEVANLNVAEISANNRFTVDQLKKEDFHNDLAWSDYQQTVNALVTAAWKAYNGKDQAVEIATCSIKLFALFGVDCKATPAWTRRLTLCCIGYKTMYSPEYKTLRANVEKAREKLEETKSNPVEKSMIDAATVAEIQTLENLIKAGELKLEAMRHEPGHVWKEFYPLLNNKRDKALKSAFKRIEDTLADIRTERDLMTDLDRMIEKETLKTERKVRDRVKAMAH